MDIIGRTIPLMERRYGIPEKTVRRMFADGLLTEHTCRKVLICDEFQSRVKRGMQKTEAKVLLSERYCISFSMVQKYIREILNGDSDG